MKKTYAFEVEIVKNTGFGLLERLSLPKFPAVEIDGTMVFSGCDVSQGQFEEAIRARLARSQVSDVSIKKTDLHELNLLNQKRYAVTAWFYDILDYPWEREYRKWRPGLLGDVSGEVLEAGVGTGRNLRYYPAQVNLTAIDFSPAMLRKAAKRGAKASCPVQFMYEDATCMKSTATSRYDWVVAFFLCCVLPRELQGRAISEFARVLKPGGRFRLLEMQYSKDLRLRKRQNRFAPFVAKVYGAGFDRETLTHLQQNPDLHVTGTRYLKHDIYLLIDGVRKA